MAHKLEKKWRSSDIKLEEKINFSVLIQNKQVLKGLKAAGFQRPSPVQAKAIPIARLGVDMFIQAKSGTGKTLVFSIAILERLKNSPKLQMLVIVPTREIAIQVQEVIYDISSGFPGLRCQSFVGGFPIDYDIEKMNDCQIAVGTPGRIRHLIENGHMSTACIKTLVLDEADKLCGTNIRMFAEVQSILRSLPYSKQIIAVSATYENEAYENIHNYMKSPRYVNMSTNELALEGVTQFFHVVEAEEKDEFASKAKFEVLKNILCSVSFSQCLIFCRYIKIVQSFCSELVKWNFPASAITGTDEQSVRFCTMDRLKKHRIKILVSSDLTSRGIDAENVDLVIHLDPSKDLETYLHRVGRAGRYGSKGVSIAIISNENEIMKLASYKTRAQLSIYPLPDPVPRCLNQYIPADKDEDSIFEYIKNDGAGEKEDTQSSKSSAHEDTAEKNGETENGNIELDDLIDSDSEEESALSEEENPDEHVNTNGNLTYNVDRKRGEASSEEEAIEFPEDNDEGCVTDSEEVSETKICETNSSGVTPNVPNETKIEMQNSTELPTIVQSEKERNPFSLMPRKALTSSDFEDKIEKSHLSSGISPPHPEAENTDIESDITPGEGFMSSNDDRKSTSLRGKDSRHSEEQENQSSEVLVRCKDAKNGSNIENSKHFSNKNESESTEPNKKSTTKILEQDFQSSVRSEKLKFKETVKKNLVRDKDNEWKSSNKFSSDFGGKNWKQLPRESQDNRFHSSAKKKQDWKSPAAFGNDCPITRTAAPQRFLKSDQNQKSINFNNRNESYRKTSYKSPHPNIGMKDTENKKRFQAKGKEYKQPDYIYREPAQRNSRYDCYARKIINSASKIKYYKPHRNYVKNKDGEKTKEYNCIPSQRSFPERKINRCHKHHNSCLVDERHSNPEEVDYCSAGQSLRKPKFNCHGVYFPISSDKNMQHTDRLQDGREHSVSYSKHGHDYKFVKPHCPFCNNEVCCERFSNMATSSLSPLSTVFHRNGNFFPDCGTNPIKWLLHPFKSYPPCFDNKYDGDIDYGKYLHEKHLSSRNKWCLSEYF